MQKNKNNPILRKKSQPIKEIDETILKLAQDMIETMNNNNGIGLSACQIGKNIRMFVVLSELLSELSSDKQVFINPEIIKISKKTETIEEGCLSLPRIVLPIKRSKSIQIKALDEQGEEFKIKAKGIPARVLQHEIDHLNGILIIDK